MPPVRTLSPVEFSLVRPDVGLEGPRVREPGEVAYLDGDGEGGIGGDALHAGKASHHGRPPLALRLFLNEPLYAVPPVSCRKNPGEQLIEHLLVERGVELEAANPVQQVASRSSCPSRRHGPSARGNGEAQLGCGKLRTCVRASGQGLCGLLLSIGDANSGMLPVESICLRSTASRLSFFTRSPEGLSILDVALTTHSSPEALRDLARWKPGGAAFIDCPCRTSKAGGPIDDGPWGWPGRSVAQARR